MKKTMLSLLIVALLLSALTGCGSRRDEGNNSTPGTNSGNTVTPDDNNGMVQDENGIIGNNATDTDVPQSGILPEIGSDIEQGANDIIDDVGGAMNGGGNNGGNGSAGGNADSNSGGGNGGSGNGSGDGSTSDSGRARGRTNSK